MELELMETQEDTELDITEQDTTPNRGRAFRRCQRMAHIRRKQRIIKDQHGYWHYKAPGMLSKGKIHCSCQMCRRKSYDHPKISDLRNMPVHTADEYEIAGQMLVRVS